MPRQIIDVESGRPAYQRRRIRRLIVVFVVIVMFVAAIWLLASRTRAEESHAPGGNPWERMLSKLTVSFLRARHTAAIVACSNLGKTTGVNVGPNFPSKTLYASNSNQNAISIYTRRHDGVEARWRPGL